MSIRLGNNIVAGRSTYQPSLFDFKWADHLLHDVQWLRADTFSWQYGSVYTPAYEHLVADIEGKEPLSETIDDIIITYYLANDGHKICMADQEGYVKRVFEKTGVAWYYILDIPFQRFKLPRTQFGFQGLKQYGNPGEYDKPGLPNITGSFTLINHNPNFHSYTEAFEQATIGIMPVTGMTDGGSWSEGWGTVTECFNASHSNSIYGASTTVQTPASEMYLYFYVGNFTQTALENTAGVSLEGVQEIMDESAVAIQGIIDEGIDAIDAAMSDLDTMINAQYHPNIFEQKWTDNILNDIQWLRSNTNSWQSGSVYETAYNHLKDEYDALSVTTVTGIIYNNTIYPRNTAYDDGDDFYGWGTTGNIVWTQDEIPTTASTLFQWISEAYVSLGTVITGITTNASQTETIAGITIVYYLAADDHKIILPDQENNAISIYNQTGTAWYYVLDTVNERFKLPRKHSTQVVQSVKNSDGTWYRLYADGWVEQGGYIATTTNQSANSSVNIGNPILPITMLDTNYITSYNHRRTGSYWTYMETNISNTSTTQIKIDLYNNGSGTWTPGSDNGIYWEVKGMSSVDVSNFQSNEKYLYFYVGKFLQAAVVNTAGLNAELFNSKADLTYVDANKVAKGHEVIEFQAPTSTNNYTWYRKYADGWVEQGCNTGSTGVILLPVTMADDKYFISTRVYGGSNNVGWNEYGSDLARTTTSFRVGSLNSIWEVKGMYAQ